MPSPYNYKYIQSSRIYYFTTINGIEYNVAFTEDDTLNNIAEGIIFENVYQLIIDKVTSSSEPHDVSVGLTIDSIVTDFFESVNNALIYICSNTDDREIVRFNAFERWYQQSCQKKHILKIDNVIQLEHSPEVFLRQRSCKQKQEILHI